MGKTEFVNNRNNGDMTWKLFAGKEQFNSSLEESAFRSANSSYQIVDIKRVVPYPQSKYKQFMYTGDVALLELSSPLKLNEAVGSVCMAEAASISSEQRCVTAGWGSDLENTATATQYLKVLPVPTVPTEQCNSSMHYNGALPEDAVCAGYLNSNQTTCYNDEGAPLMCFNDDSDQWQLEGILSYHGNCGKRPHPAIYNSITSNISTWIRRTVGNGLMFERAAITTGSPLSGDESTTTATTFSSSSSSSSPSSTVENSSSTATTTTVTPDLSNSSSTTMAPTTSSGVVR